MLNDHIAHDEAKEIMKQRIEEAKDYNLQNELGYGDSRAFRWIFLFLLVVVVLVVGTLL